MFQVKKAKRQKLHAAISVMGASGSGKTLSSLLIAYGMMLEKYPKASTEEIWSKIGLLDTEHKRSLMYEGMELAGIKVGEFQHIDFNAPYEPSRYKAGVQALKNAGCEVVIVDSLSHVWEGEGGLLEMQQQQGGNFQAWAKIKPHIHDFIKTLTQSDIHVIGTMRTKQDYAMETNELGKVQIKKLGLKPIMKDDLEYEFMVVFQIDQDHNARTTKDNSTIFEGTSFKITPDVGSKLFQWLEKGIDVQAEKRQKRDEIVDKIRSLQVEMKNDDLDNYVKELEGKVNTSLESFSLEFVEKALMLIENKAKELGGK